MDWLGKTATAAGALVFGLALLLVFLALAALPRGERHRVRGAALWLVLYVFWRWLEPRLSLGATDARFASALATFALLCSMARSAFLLVFQSRLARRFTRPWPRILRDLLQGFLYFAVALVALRVAGVEPGSLLATSALLTAVIGLSLQETLGNLFAGLSLQAQPPFSIGDWLQFNEGPDGIGRVIEINWRATHLVTIGEVEVIVPNGVIAKAPLRNFSRPTRLIRQSVSLVLPDWVAPDRVQRLVLAVLADLPGVLAAPPPSVIVLSFMERGTTYSIRYYIEDFASLEPIEGELRKRLWYRLRRENIELPPPRTRAEGMPAGGSPTSLREPNATPGPTIAERLAKVEFLSSAGPEVLERLAQGTQRAMFGPGEVIVREGERGDELFVLERGTVEVMLVRDAGPGKQVATLQAGQFFGEAALLRDEQRTATVVALTECELLVISGGAFRAAAELDRAIAERLTTKLALRLTELHKAISEEGGQDDERHSLQLIERVKRFFQ